MDPVFLTTEADVENHFIIDLLTGSSFLGIPRENVKGKTYLAATVIDKRSGKSHGYYPDFSIWIDALPLLIVEAKAPEVDVSIGYREATLYAHHLNKQFRSGLNPCTIIIATNGKSIVFGYWDADPIEEIPNSEIAPGTLALSKIRNFCGYAHLVAQAKSFRQRLRPENVIAPYLLAGGTVLINSKKVNNTFAAPLSPVLRKYFTSKQQNNDPEIYKNSYIASDETNSYDQVLESLMRERLIELRGPLSETLQPTRRGEPKLAKVVKEFEGSRPSGQLQLITGGVGTGKSLFVRRYKELLQSEEQKKSARWAFIDFNAAPKNFDAAENWICESFTESFNQENKYDAYDSENWSQVFSIELKHRKSIYADIAKSSKEQAIMAKATDQNNWISDPKRVAFGLARHFLGERRDTVIVVMDNVDQQGTEEQLQIFRLSLWFMAQSRAFVILNLRDDTFERFKGEPPLDTFRTGITFHISPPRFIDVVKRRLELSAAYLAANTLDKLEYSTAGGLKITYPKSMIGKFLKEMYLEIFDIQHNTSKIVQGLAGRDVRKALEIFEGVLRSGHISEEAITSRVQGANSIEIEEDSILKSLMRGDYRFHSNNSGFISNIFYCDPAWVRPSNFIMIDILFLLYQKRKQIGEIGLEGFFSVSRLGDELQLRGYVNEDVYGAANFLVQRGLVEADHFHLALSNVTDSVKITYSGFIHIRFLVERIEYLYGVLATTPVFNLQIAENIAVALRKESDEGDIPPWMKIKAISEFYQHLKNTYISQSQSFPLFGDVNTGSRYVIETIDTLLYALREKRPLPAKLNPLDSFT